MVALFWAGAPRVPLFLMALTVFFIGFDHAFPFGSLTFGSFFLIALWLELSRRKRVPGEGDPRPASAPVSEAKSR